MSKADGVSQVQRVDKPSGHQEWFALADGKFCGRAIHVSAGRSHFLQNHERVLPCHHGDPIDRALVAQARSEGLVLVTADPALQAYDVELLDATR